MLDNICIFRLYCNGYLSLLLVHAHTHDLQASLLNPTDLIPRRFDVSTATHLVIASRHPLHREALALALRSSHDCAATITTLVPNHVLEYLQEHNADIVVMAGDPSDCDWLSILFLTL